MEPQSLDPRIVFEDQHLIVLVKPSGLLSQGEHTGDPNLVDWCRKHFGRNYVGLVHRLDRNTSGLMVVAKRSKAAERLTENLQSGRLVRRYLAWLHGELHGGRSLEHWLMKDERTNEVRVFASSSEADAQAKRAALRMKAIRHGAYRGAVVTLCEFELETGRSHQIRAQSALIGHPVVGDPKYGSTEYARAPFPRLALHSHHLAFPHPMTKEEMKFDDSLPDDLKF